MILTLEVPSVTISNTGGRVLQGLILSRTGTTMRVAVNGFEDAEQFTCVKGTWISENCEPVEIQFEWRRHALTEPISDAGSRCSEEMANRFVHVVVSGGEAECKREVPMLRASAVGR